LKTNDYIKNININVVFLLIVFIWKLVRLKEMKINYFPILMA